MHESAGCKPTKGKTIFFKLNLLSKVIQTSLTNGKGKKTDYKFDIAIPH